MQDDSSLGAGEIDTSGDTRSRRNAVLRQATIFRDVEDQDVALLARIASCHLYHRGAIVNSSADSEGAIYVVASGSVRVYLLSDAGKEFTLFTCGEGEVFELEQIEEEVNGDVVVAAVKDDTVLYAIPWDQFLEIVAFRPGAVGSLADLLREGLLNERRLVKELAFHNMRSRLAHKLAELAADDPQCIVTKSRDELASLVGTQSAEVSRALTHFLGEGLIYFRPHGRSVTVLDRERLANY